MLQLSFVGAITGEYLDFTTAQRAALRMLAARLGLPIAEQDVIAMVDRMNSLPAHPEVGAALQRLRATPLKVVALTNSVSAVAEAQLTNAKLRELFDGVLSADSVQQLKPAKAPYLTVAAAFGVDALDVRLVAAHSWSGTSPSVLLGSSDAGSRGYGAFVRCERAELNSA